MKISSSGRVLGYKVHEVEVVLAKSQLREAFANDPAKLSARMDLRQKRITFGWWCATRLQGIWGRLTWRRDRWRRMFLRRASCRNES